MMRWFVLSVALGAVGCGDADLSMGPTRTPEWGTFAPQPPITVDNSNPGCIPRSNGTIIIVCPR